MELVGWLSGALLAGCMAPQAYKVVHEGNANGTSWGMLAMWSIGEVLGIVYLSGLAVTPLPIMFNYAANTALAAIIVGYKVCRKN